MNEKCNKYEDFFIFASEEAFQKHLEDCPECQAEHNKMLKISSLVKEAKPLYFKKERKSKLVKLVASLLLMAVCSGFITIQFYNEKYNNLVIAQDSIVAEMGFPYDEYGLLSIE